MNPFASQPLRAIAVLALSMVGVGSAAGTAPAPAEPARLTVSGSQLLTPDGKPIWLRGKLGSTCQRCMQPLAIELDTDSRVVLVASEVEAEAVPEGWETYLAADGMLSIPALVAEEVLLALPIVPRHAEADCGAAQPVAATPAPAPEALAMTRPFSDLKALLKEFDFPFRN